MNGPWVAPSCGGSRPGQDRLPSFDGANRAGGFDPDQTVAFLRSGPSAGQSGEGSCGEKRERHEHPE